MSNRPTMRNGRSAHSLPSEHDKWRPRKKPLYDDTSDDENRSPSPARFRKKIQSCPADSHLRSPSPDPNYQPKNGARKVRSRSSEDFRDEHYREEHSARSIRKVTQSAPDRPDQRNGGFGRRNKNRGTISETPSPPPRNMTNGHGRDRRYNDEEKWDESSKNHQSSRSPPPARNSSSRRRAAARGNQSDSSSPSQSPSKLNNREKVTLKSGTARESHSVKSSNFRIRYYNSLNVTRPVQNDDFPSTRPKLNATSVSSPLPAGKSFNFVERSSPIKIAGNGDRLGSRYGDERDERITPNVIRALEDPKTAYSSEEDVFGLDEEI